MAKMKRITAALLLALVMCFSFSSISTVSADELSSDDWEQISLDLQQGDQQSGEDFGFIKNNTSDSDDGEWILYLGIGFVVLGLCGITYAVLSSKRQRALAKKRRAEYIRRMNNQKRNPSEVRRGTRNPQQRRPVQNQQTARGNANTGVSRGGGQQRSQNNYGGGYIKGSSRYADGGARNSQPSYGNNTDMYSDSSYGAYGGNYRNESYNRGNYDDGFRTAEINNSRNYQEDGTRSYSRNPAQNRWSDQYEDISSFSSADKNIYSSSSRKNNYINDYIDY